MQALTVAKLRRVQEAAALISQFIGEAAQDEALKGQVILLGLLQEKAREVKNGITRLLDTMLPSVLAVQEKQIVDLVNKLATYEGSEIDDPATADAAGELTVETGTISPPDGDPRRTAPVSSDGSDATTGSE
jgi:hypothetical protein